MKKRILRAVVVLVLLAAPVYNLLAYASQEGKAVLTEETDVSAIYELAGGDVAQIETEIEKIDAENRRNAILEAQRKERQNNESKLREQIKNGTVTYRGLFGGTLIVGDSLMYGLQAYGILDSGNLVAKVSASLYHLSDNLDKIINNNPKILISHYGLNLVTSSSSTEKFIATYSELLKQLKKALPNTKIVVSGMFNVLPSAVKSNSGLSRIAEYNNAMKKMCSDNGFTFLDNSTLLNSSMKDYYLADGMHLKKAFYVNVWLPKTVIALGL